MESEYASLDDPRYDELVRRDFIYHNLQNRDGGALRIEHMPSGVWRGKRIPEMGMGRRYHDTCRAMEDSLIAELREKGVRPALPVTQDGVKKIGKARWAKQPDSSAKEANEVGRTDNISMAE